MKVASKEFNFTKDSKLFVTRDKFFSNYENKSHFIKHLMQELQTNYIKWYQEKEEADELLVEIAIKDNTNLQNVIVAEDIDVIVILTGRAKADEEIYFLKLSKQNVAAAVYSPKSLETNFPNCSKFIIFAHCFTGCDSTSAFYNKGKTKIIDILEKRQGVREKASIFYNNHSNVEEMLQAGQYCTVILYGFAKDTKLNKLRKVIDLPAYLEKK